MPKSSQSGQPGVRASPNDGQSTQIGEISACWGANMSAPFGRESPGNHPERGKNVLLVSRGALRLGLGETLQGRVSAQREIEHHHAFFQTDT